MFIPYFIAILLGLATPSNTNTNCGHNNGTTVSAYDDGGTPPGDDTGGEGGHVPPIKPPIKP